MNRSDDSLERRHSETGTGEQQGWRPCPQTAGPASWPDSRWLCVPVLAAVLLTSGCGTILCGTKQKITIETQPAGARVQIGTTVVTTPATVNLPRGAFHTLIVSQEGHQTKAVDLDTAINPWWWLNVPCYAVVFASLPMAIDARLGGGYQLEPGQVQLTLPPVAPGAAPLPRPNGVTPLPQLAAAALLAPPTTPGHCRIVVVCPRKFPMLRARLRDGDDTVGVLRPWTFLTWERQAGKVAVATSDGQVSRFVELRAEAGQVYFFEQDFGWFSGLRLEVISEAEARQKLAQCQPTPSDDYVVY